MFGQAMGVIMKIRSAVVGVVCVAVLVGLLSLTKIGTKLSAKLKSSASKDALGESKPLTPQEVKTLRLSETARKSLTTKSLSTRSKNFELISDSKFRPVNSSQCSRTIKPFISKEALSREKRVYWQVSLRRRGRSKRSSAMTTDCRGRKQVPRLRFDTWLIRLIPIPARSWWQSSDWIAQVRRSFRLHRWQH